MKYFYCHNALLLGLTLAFVSACSGEVGKLEGATGATGLTELTELTEGEVAAEPAEEEVFAPEEEMAFYWYEGKKIVLSPSTTHRAVRYSEKATPHNMQEVAAVLNAAAEGAEDLGNGIVLYTLGEASPSPFAHAPALGALPADASELAVFNSPSGNALILTEEFNVQFKEGVTQQHIDAFNEANKVRIVSASSWEANAFVLAVEEEAQADALVMSNRYYDSGLVVYASPNFLQMIQRTFVPNDPMFAQQWALNNTRQNGKGIAGKDIRAVAAWDITRGSANITIAIIDEGVETTHPDLNTSGKLVTGYDAILRRDNPNPVNSKDNHGTACAGIAAAAGNNGIGISGVAPGSRLMGVRIAQSTSGGGWSTTDSALADGIATAANRGADVLSNSWGGGSPNSVVTNAIRHAKSNGRGGKGAIVIFATGNNNGPVSYPGNLPEVFAVAACDQSGARASFSNYGSQVDVCAPGVEVHATTTGGGYMSNFSGTSAATPVVAGVAALVLSVNPNLTAAQLEQILRNSADNVGSPGRDNYTGYGFVNALKAVQAAGGTPPGDTPSCTLSAPVASIPQGGGTYKITANCTNAPSGYAWTVDGVKQNANGSTLDYVFQANNAAAARSFTIAVTASNNAGTGNPAQLVLNQPGTGAGQKPSCTLSASVASIPQGGGTYRITANCTNTPSGYSWTVNGTRQAATGNTLDYVFLANNTSSPRSFTFIVTASNNAGTSDQVQLVLTQAGLSAGNKPVCSFSSSSASISGNGGSYYITVNCTGSPTSYEWYVNNQKQSGTRNPLIYTFPANNTLGTRTFNIVVVAANSAGKSNAAQLVVYQPRR